MRLAAWCILLVSCAAPTGPGELHQAAFRPPPAQHRPGVGAPVLGQPGTTEVHAPRSPHARVLPPSKEKGVWAGDEPRATKGDLRTGTVHVLDVELQVPIIDVDASEEEDITALVAKSCEESIALVITQTLRLKELVARLSAPERTCWATNIYEECVEARRMHLLETLKDVQTKEADAVRFGLNVAVSAARARSKASCAGMLTPAVAEAIQRWSAAAYVRPVPKGPRQ